MNWKQAVPNWLTLGLVAAIVVGVLTVVGWVKPYLSGPDVSLATIYRPKPAPVKVETTKWLTRVEKQIVRERVSVPVEVIRELPAKEAARIAKDFAITLPELHAENRELVDVVTIPQAPRGGEMAITVNTASGAIDGIFRARAAPLIEFGGLREVGLEYDVLHAAPGGYYRQDLVRIGPAVVNGRVFAAMPGKGAPAAYGAAIGVSVRF